ncbi:hypothetical protein ACJX0J_013438, partial [Zea mays]
DVCLPLRGQGFFTHAPGIIIQLCYPFNFYFYILTAGAILAFTEHTALAFFLDLHLIVLSTIFIIYSLYPDFGGFTWTKKHAFLIDYKYYYTANVVDKLSDNEQYIIYVGGINLR